ncbi:MAG TPA: alpha/beta hydrolase [Anaerolineae bacterium]|nr:alpha/beta hydrolase [Anaerolineae bacterium]
MSLESPVQVSAEIAARIAPGSGEKVLWLHGYTMDSSIWGELWRFLPEWYHLGIDLPGHGASAPIAGTQTFPALGQTLGQLALEHGVRHIIGLSFGGMVALQVASEFPDSFATFTLGSPGLGGGPQDPHARDQYRELMRTYWEKGAGPWMTDLWMQWPPDIFKGASEHPQLWQQLREIIDRHSWAELRNPGMQNLTTYQQRNEALQKIQAAILILVGEQDIPVFRATAELIQRQIPDTHCEVVAQAGHLSMLEKPLVASELIAAHLRSHAF